MSYKGLYATKQQRTEVFFVLNMHYCTLGLARYPQKTIKQQEGKPAFILRLT
ncbi:MAG: hypothetical protein AAF392_03015 [Bacteroidota bacterium]